MSTAALARFTRTAAHLVAANDAAREARIALLVARADFAAWSAELGTVAS